MVENRSEIVFLYDARNCNPNGNPLDDNRPRIDRETGECLITDVRLKRFIREQLLDDGHGVFTRLIDGQAASRAELALEQFDDVNSAEDVEKIENIYEEFLDNAVDVRYFGETLSFNSDSDDEVLDAIYNAFEGRPSVTGALQFEPSRSLNKVEENEETNSLTSVIGTSEGKNQGGFDLQDYRIKYGIFPFHGVVTPRLAQMNRMDESDVRRLDSLCWRAIKNQADSRSKKGHSPRFYARVEYTGERYDGGLHLGLDIDEDQSKPEPKIRSILDVAVDMSYFVNRLEENSEHIDVVRMNCDGRLTTTVGEQTFEGDELTEYIQDNTDVEVEQVDPYEEAGETMPENDDE